MKRLLSLALCAFAIAAAVSSCGGGGDDYLTDKLTVIGAGS